MRKFFKFRTIVLIIALVFLKFVLNAQSSNKEKVDYKNFDLVESYTVETVTRISLPKGINPNEVNILDQISIMPTKEVKHVTKYLDKAGKYTETIMYERPEHIEKWINYPYKIEIDGKGIKSYGKKGEILSSSEFDIEKRGEIENKKQGIISKGKFTDVDFSNLTEEENSEIEKNNGRVKKISAYGIEVDFDTLKYRSIPEKMIKQHLIYNTKGKLLNSVAFKYSKNAHGDLYLHQKTDIDVVEKNHKNGSSIECKKVVVEKTNNYAIYKSDKYAKTKARNANQNMWVIDNNPVLGEYLGIRYQGEFENSKSISIKVTDINGKVRFEKFINDFYRMESIDVSQLPEGLYLISIGEKEKTAVTLKFVKH